MHYTLAHRKDKNCPSFIDGVIHEFFEVGLYDQGMEYDWHYVEPGEALKPLPEHLTLITKDKLYAFDFCSGFGGHLVSERFLNAFDQLKKGRWEVSKLKIVNPKGVAMPSVSYFFIRQRREDCESPDVINLDSSTLQFRKNGEIKSISALVINDDVSLDAFCIQDVSLLGYVILSEQAQNLLQNLDLKGVDIVGVEKIGSVKRA